MEKMQIVSERVTLLRVWSYFPQIHLKNSKFWYSVCLGGNSHVLLYLFFFLLGHQLSASLPDICGLYFWELVFSQEAFSVFSHANDVYLQIQLQSDKSGFFVPLIAVLIWIHKSQFRKRFHLTRALALQEERLRDALWSVEFFWFDFFFFFLVCVSYPCSS